MDSTIVFFWIVTLSCASGLIASLRRLSLGTKGWCIVYALILGLNVLGFTTGRAALIQIAALAWVVFVLSPNVLIQRFQLAIHRQRYATALRLSRCIALLHPADGWRQQPLIMRAMLLSQQNRLDDALTLLAPLRDEKSSIGFSANATFFRLTNRWEDFLEWMQSGKNRYGLHPNLMPGLMRALGECGNIPALLELYRNNSDAIATMSPPIARDNCLLVLFAFCGRRETVESILNSSLSVLPEKIKQFWLATADLMAGRTETARAQFEALLPGADASLQLSIARRLMQCQMPPPLLIPDAGALLNNATAARENAERFGTGRNVFSRHARAIQCLIVLNLVMFVVEMLNGGSENFETLHRLGALCPEEVRAGEWWRLIAATFLHFGPLHVVLNMYALASLGPMIESAFGSLKFLTIYLGAGIGSMFTVFMLARTAEGAQIVVGASGSVMGIVGATAALMLRGWWRDNSLVARRRLFIVLAILAAQTFLDAVIPHVSMTAHLSGAVAGFALAALLRDGYAKNRA